MRGAPPSATTARSRSRPTRGSSASSAATPREAFAPRPALKRPFDVALSGLGLLGSAPALGAHRRRDQARGRRARLLRPGAGGQGRPALSELEVPLDGGGRRPAIRRAPGGGGRPARDPHRSAASGHGDGRAAPALEHPGGRHELRRPAGAPARGDRGRRRRHARAASGDPGVRGAPSRHARPHRASRRSTPRGTSRAARSSSSTGSTSASRASGSTSGSSRCRSGSPSAGAGSIEAERSEPRRPAGRFGSQ